MCAGRFCPFRRSTFTDALCSFFGTICVFPRKHGISGNAGPLTGARLSRHVHPRGGCGTFCMLLKCWQAWVEMRGGFGYHYVRQASLMFIVGKLQRHFDRLQKSWSVYFLGCLMMISCGGRNTSDASVAGLRKKVFKAYLALAKCRVFFARHFAKRHILTMDGGRYFFFRGMVFVGFHCLPDRRLKWRSSHLHRCIYV